MSLRVEVDDIDLHSYLATPESGIGTSGIVLCHGFPQAPREAASAGLRYSELADRIVEQVGLPVLTFNFRGTGQSGGDFSIGGWCTDLQTAIHHLRVEHGVDEIWLAGFGTGASLVLHMAGVDQTVSGVTSFSARAHFDDWADNWERLLEHARNLGLVHTPGFPEDPEKWGNEFRLIRPVDVVDKIAPRPLMIVHGADDDRVPVSDARELAAAAGPQGDLRILAGAGHRLRHDPRTLALLLGWLDRRR